MTTPTSSSSSSDQTDNDNFDQSKHLSILHQNLIKFTQRGLLERMEISEEENWDDAVHMNLQFALLSHGSVNGLDGPIHNYANFAACSAFELSRTALLQIPACRVAAPGMDQETWSMILQRLQQDHGNVLEDYQGYRASLKNGRRFYIRDAVVRTNWWCCQCSNSKERARGSLHLHWHY